AAAAAVLYLRPAPLRGSVEKYEISFPGLILDSSHRPALSPDGRKILYVGAGGLWIRDLASLESRLLTGTEGASFPIWSPDGSMIAFSRQGGIWTMPQAGGQASLVADAVGLLESVGGISWDDQDGILFATGDGGISEIPSRGGEARSLVEPDQKTVSDMHDPRALPGERGILYVAHRMASTFDSIRLLANGESSTLLQIDDQELRTPVYSPAGYLLYGRQSGNAGLWAVAFSLSDSKVTGEPFLVARDASFPSVASDGSILFAWKVQALRRQLVWRDREGKEAGTVGPDMESIQSPALSPDGRHVAAMVQENSTWDIWSLDIERGTRLRLTFTPAKDWDPAWSADGRQVLFWEGKTRAVSTKPSDGTGALERLVKEDFLDSGEPMASPDGKTLIFWVRNTDTKGDIYVMPLDGERRPVPFLHSPFGEDEPRFSPDGKLVAYISDESGRREIYLTTFPGAQGKWQVSVNGGNDERWDPRGGRLYYLQGADLMEVEVATSPSVSLGTPQKLFTIDGIDTDAWWLNRFAVSADGQRFLVAKTLKPEGSGPTMVLVKNWVREFDRKD
ncbi:MAG TPA: hypothetical protein VNI57_01160, partial [Candidatus Saccharimonadales bacterium]|nr:hypothetical protein [Candidatus Saccharimonadales bacterium]